MNFANAWHSDLSYLPAPPAYTLLHAWDVPDHGGDTVWSNQYLAYETLSSGLKATLDGLRAVHSAGMAYGTGGLLDQFKDLTSMAIAPSAEAYAEHVHPVVTVHPVTGPARPVRQPRLHDPIRRAGPRTSQQPLLAHLHRHSINENFTCRLRWSVADAGHLGQPLHHAQRAERLLGRAPGDVPHQRQGHRAHRGRAVTARRCVGSGRLRRPTTGLLRWSEPAEPLNCGTGRRS